MSHAERKAMINGNSTMSVTMRCKWLGISRRSAYTPPRRQASDADLKLMRLIDAEHTAHPTFGPKQMVRRLQRLNVRTGRNRVRRLMRLMGLSAVLPKRHGGGKAKPHKVFPCLLRGLTIDRPDQVWCADITYIPMGSGFLYLVAVMDWATRCVLSWRLSNGMGAAFCVDALQDALRSTGRAPWAFNTDQGVQFTSAEFVSAVQACGARVSMDGKGCWMDNVFIERLWRSLKQEAVHLHDLSNGLAARRVIGEWFEFHNNARPHTALDGDSPARVYERLTQDSKGAVWQRAA